MLLNQFFLFYLLWPISNFHLILHSNPIPPFPVNLSVSNLYFIHPISALILNFHHFLPHANFSIITFPINIMEYHPIQKYSELIFHPYYYLIILILITIQLISYLFFILVNYYHPNHFFIHLIIIIIIHLIVVFSDFYEFIFHVVNYLLALNLHPIVPKFPYLIAICLMHYLLDFSYLFISIICQLIPSVNLLTFAHPRHHLSFVIIQNAFILRNRHSFKYLTLIFYQHWLNYSFTNSYYLKLVTQIISNLQHFEHLNGPHLHQFPYHYQLLQCLNFIDYPIHYL